MKTKYHLVTAGLIIGTLSTPVIAANGDPEPIIVTATRLGDNGSDATSHMTIITAEDIRHSTARTLPELLNLEAGVNGRSLYGNNAARATIDIRGFGATSTQNTLLLLDGRRLNDVDMSAVDYAALPLRGIERIEITRGGGAVLYGDGAVGGTINIITKRADRAGSTGYVQQEYGSYDSGRIATEFSQNNGRLAINLITEAMTSNGYRDNNELDQKNLQLTTRLLQDNGELFLRLGANDQKLRTPGARTVDPTSNLDELHDDRRGTNTPNDFSDHKGRHINAGISRYLGTSTELIVDAGYRKNNQAAFLDLGGFPEYIDTDLSTGSLTPRMDITHLIGNYHAETQIGIDYYRSNYTSSRAQTEGTISTPIHVLDVDQKSTAIYVQNHTELSGHTTLNAGIRTQKVKLAARDTFDASAPGASFGSEAADLDTSDNENSYELGLREQINKSTVIFGKLARSVRFATIDEIFELDPATFVQLFSPLDPQTANSIELGIDFTHARYSATASLYRINLDNEIHFDPVSFTNENLDPTRRYGLEASMKTQIDETLAVKANLAYTRTEFRDGAYQGNDVPLVPRNTASLSALWDITPMLQFAASINHVGKKYFDNDENNGFGKIPSYQTIDLKLTVNEGPWHINGTINNAFDKKAFDYGAISTFTAGRYNAYPLPERNWLLSVMRDF